MKRRLLCNYEIEKREREMIVMYFVIVFIIMFAIIAIASGIMLLIGYITMVVVLSFDNVVNYVKHGRNNKI